MSWVPPTPLDAVRIYLNKAFPGPEAREDGVRVTTHCMYPSNGLVRVYVKAGNETAVVSDEGEAVGEVLSAGIDVADVNRLARHIVADQGLLIRGGIIQTPRIRIEAMPIPTPLRKWLNGFMIIRRSNAHEISEKCSRIILKALSVTV